MSKTSALRQVLTSLGKDDRYEKAAKILAREMDEIFLYAQELQDAMDRQHEEGLYNEPEDSWTLDVWVAKE